MTTPSGAPSPQDEIAGHVHEWKVFHGDLYMACEHCDLDVLDWLESQAVRIGDLTNALEDLPRTGCTPAEWATYCNRVSALLTSPSQPERKEIK